MSCAPSASVVSRRDWVLSEDPDLAALRRTDEFKHFEAIYFPLASRTPQRPDNVHTWEQNRYTHNLLAETARRLEQVWHQRRDEVDLIDPQDVLHWYGDEEEAWELVGSVTREYHHWGVRYGLIERMAQWSAEYGFDALIVTVPRFDDHGFGPGREGERDRDRVESEICDDEKRLKQIGEHLTPVNADAPRLKQLQIELRDRVYLHRRPAMPQLPYVCDERAGLWQRLHEWVDEKPLQDHAGSRQAFADAMTQAGGHRGAREVS
jgi:hypothetical protein